MTRIVDVIRCNHASLSGGGYLGGDNKEEKSITGDDDDMSGVIHGVTFLNTVFKIVAKTSHSF